MKVTMDHAGRLVIPREIRREASLQPGTPLEIRVHDGTIEIEPQPLKVRIEKRGRLSVAVPLSEVPPLSANTVEKTRRALRHRTDAGRK